MFQFSQTLQQMEINRFLKSFYRSWKLLSIMRSKARVTLNLLKEKSHWNSWNVYYKAVFLGNEKRKKSKTNSCFSSGICMERANIPITSLFSCSNTALGSYNRFFGDIFPVIPWFCCYYLMLAALYNFYPSILPNGKYTRGKKKAPKTQLHALPFQQSSVGIKVK